MNMIAAITKKSLVHEMFVSRQGEGLFVGEKQIFLRFSRCNMACAYCDTNNEIGSSLSLEEVASQIERLRWQEGEVASLSLTGGEPLLHAAAIPALSEIARNIGLKVFLETNGTLPEAMKAVRESIDIVSMDIKLPSVGKTRPFWDEHRVFLRECRGLRLYLKIVLSQEAEETDFRQALDLIAEEDPRLPTVLQPVTPLGGLQPIRAEKLQRFKEMALSCLWDVRIQPQWHKMWKIR